MDHPVAPDGTAAPFDVIVIGGSFAGMSAALQLVRARRRVLVIDADAPRNRAAARAHGCLGWDGVAPERVLATARAQLAAYPGVAWITDEAGHAQGDAARGFEVTCVSGRVFRARRLILAHGVVDHLPNLPGLDERWGSSVLHCPYCHGYELAQGNIAALVATAEEAREQAAVLPDWGEVTVLHYGGLDAGAAADLAPALHAQGVHLEPVPVVRLSGAVTVTLADARTRTFAAVFIHPRSTLSVPLAAQLGCSVEDAGCITTDSAKQTTVTGVFACGDAARFAGSMALAIGEGALAGVAAHRSLLGLLA